MATKKDRRQSGYVTPQATIPPKDLEKLGLMITPFYDDWNDYRDGFRDWFKDFKKIKEIRRNMKFDSGRAEKRERMNLKQKRLLKRRRQRKQKLRYKES